MADNYCKCICKKERKLGVRKKRKPKDDDWLKRILNRIQPTLDQRELVLNPIHVFCLVDKSLVKEETFLPRRRTKIDAPPAKESLKQRSSRDSVICFEDLQSLTEEEKEEQNQTLQNKVQSPESNQAEKGNAERKE